PFFHTRRIKETVMPRVLNGCVPKVLNGPALAAVLLLGSTAALAEDAPGVTRSEIRIATIQDLSGPVVSFGKQARDGMLMRVEEINEAGGIHGRKLTLLVEDSGYDPKRAVLAAQRLTSTDNGIFAAVGNLGTAVAIATMPIFLDSNVLHLFPLTSARQTFEPVHRLKYTVAPTYFDNARVAVKQLSAQRPDRKWCALYQDDDFGLEVVRGAEHQLKEMGSELIARTTYKRGATDFSSQISRLKAAGCDSVVLGTIVRETVGVVTEARKLGFEADFVGSTAAYGDQIHKLGGEAMNGFMAASFVNQPYADSDSPALNEWFKRYRERTGEDPGVFSVYGYQMVDWFATAAENAGPDLTTDAYIATLESKPFPQDIFGTAQISFTPTRHLGLESIRLSKIVDGKWQPMTEFEKP